MTASINLARACVLNESNIRKIASYCIYFARSKSPLGLNVFETVNSQVNGLPAFHGVC